MISRRILAAAAGLAAFALIPQPLAAQDERNSEGISIEPMADLFAGLFQADPLTPEQEARLPAAGVLVATMLPEGFYAEMMTEVMDGMLGPMLGMFNGETGATIVLQSRLDLAPEALEQVSEEQKVELATLLDPGFAERGEVMGKLLGGVMTKAAVLIEPLFREGMTKAYAARFDEAQLADIGTFFATPTGQLYARESIRLMADPQVMGASMQAMPAMMGDIGTITAELETVMAALPPEKAFEDHAPAERARLAAVLGVDESDLAIIVREPKAMMPEESF